MEIKKNESSTNDIITGHPERSRYKPSDRNTEMLSGESVICRTGFGDGTCISLHK